MTTAERERTMEMLSSIPHDAAAIFIYFLLVAAGAAIWKGNRGADSSE